METRSKIKNNNLKSSEIDTDDMNNNLDNKINSDNKIDETENIDGLSFLNNIKKETLIICNDDSRLKILMRNKLINVKVMNMNQFISKYCFDYDENTILYIMNKYNVKYEIALVYIKNLYYIENKVYGVKKLDFLVELKKDLDNKNLLIYNSNFKDYLNDIDIIVYGIRLGKYEKYVLKDINYKYIKKELYKYEHNIYSFDTMDNEVEYIAVKICELLDKGIPVKNIKLTNVDSSYYNTLVRIFTMFNLRVNAMYTSTLSSFEYIKNFINLYKENDLRYAIDNIDKKNKLYDTLVDTINKYIKYDNKDLIIYKLEHTNVSSYQYDNGIEIVDFLEYDSNDNDYIFMFGFNDGIVPNSYKDIDYITDNIKDKVHLDTTKEKNQNLREDILNAIYDIKNLVITYKSRDTKRTFYPSSMCTYFNVVDGVINTDVSYSEVYNKIKLTRCIDNYIKYGKKDNNFDILNSNFKVNYNSFKNEYSLINRVMDKLNLSYSKMQIYNKCAFRYYLSNVLKLDIFEENFSTVIGSMVHYVMEKCLSNNDMDTDKYVLKFLNNPELCNRKLSNKEMFFLEKYKVCIKDLLNQVMLEREYSSYNDYMYEKRIEIDYGNNIKFVGIIDKILYKEDGDNTYVTLIDYKTGNDDISLKYLDYGINIQLPIYLYLSDYLNLRNIVYSGFYLQKFNITDGDYRLIGYSNSDRDILSVLDNNYDNSKIIKGMKTLKDGSFSKYTKVLSNEEIDKIKNITKDKIDEVINNIKENKFDINPKIDGDKNIGCDYCKFKDICFVKKKNKVAITAVEFGGEDNNGLDE